MNALRSNFRILRQRLSWPDILALILGIVGGVFALFGISGGIYSFAKFLALLAALYLLARVMSLWSQRLLWSLRNRLIVAYLFVALVPVLLVVLLSVQAAMILYTQLGGYLLYEDVQKRTDLIADGADQIAAALRIEKGNIQRADAEKIVSQQEHEVLDARLPGLQIEFPADAAFLARVAGPAQNRFSGLIQEGSKVDLVALDVVQTSRGPLVVKLSVPVTPALLATLAPDLDAVFIDVVEPYSGGPRRGVVYPVGDKYYVSLDSIRAKSRPESLAPPSLFDPIVSGVSRFAAVRLLPDGSVTRSYPVVAKFIARPSRLNRKIFSSLGDLGYLNYLGFIAVAIVLALLELAALITGIVMTRRITRGVDDLYKATQHVQARDYSYRVRVDRNDQLGRLGKSFNGMIESVSTLLEEQRERHKLENEISIAREVQNQLFPQELPRVPGVEIEAICNAARTVSGDYYDFIQLTPTSLAIAIADISGKGISAALLMASLQASLRSLILADGSQCLSTAELVARLNKHLVRNTGDDRFATFFVAVYDSAQRSLRYTNAGHLPSFCISDGSVQKLDKGGIVLGVVEDYPFEEGSLILPPGALLIGYSDGLVEPENVYGEEFGIQRLKEAALSLQNETPKGIAAGLMQAAEEWASTPEQADDMTVVVARLG
jgi:sigma-B regulation protein RsbU (phosphoserine phosphatase)